MVITAIMIALAVFFPGLMRVVYFFPVLGLIGCALWVGWNLLTGMSHLDFNSFAACCALAVLPALVWMSKI